MINKAITALLNSFYFEMHDAGNFWMTELEGIAQNSIKLLLLHEHEIYNTLFKSFCKNIEGYKVFKKNYDFMDLYPYLINCQHFISYIIIFQFDSFYLKYQPNHFRSQKALLQWYSMHFCQLMKHFERHFSNSTVLIPILNCLFQEQL